MARGTLPIRLCVQLTTTPALNDGAVCSYHYITNFADVNECTGITCSGGSTCTNGLNKYTCSTCAAGWTGGGDNAVCTGAH